MPEESSGLFGPKKNVQEGAMGFPFRGGSYAFILFLILILLFFGDN